MFGEVEGLLRGEEEGGGHPWRRLHSMEVRAVNSSFLGVTGGGKGPAGRRAVAGGEGGEAGVGRVRLARTAETAVAAAAAAIFSGDG